MMLIAVFAVNFTIAVKSSFECNRRRISRQTRSRKRKKKKNRFGENRERKNVTDESEWEVFDRFNLAQSFWAGKHFAPGLIETWQIAFADLFLFVVAPDLSLDRIVTDFPAQGSLFNKVDAYFSSFRRCNYPRVSSAGVVEIVQECGRYSRFWDIPSPWWQASTILVGVASGLSLLVGVTAAAACCVTYVIHSGTARAAGFLQLCAALMVCSGVALYPIGWDNREIKESCGESAHVYKIGNCNVSWSAYLLLGAVTLLLFCFGLSFCASRIKPGGSFRI